MQNNLYFPYYAQRRLERFFFFLNCFSFYIGNVGFCLEVAIVMTPKLAANCNAISCFLTTEELFFFKL